MKVALAGILAFYVSEAARLDSPQWSVLTVILLFTSPYLGSIAEKSFFRIIGTTVGGLLGFLLVGNFAQYPIILLPTLAALLILCVHRYGGQFVPYAFYLCAMTALLVVSTSLNDPSEAWEVARSRTLEISIGVIVSVLVSMVFFPRRATAAFRSESSRLAGNIDRLLAANCAAALQDAPLSPQLPALKAEIVSQVSKLRSLLHFATLESELFRKHEAAFAGILLALRSIRDACLALETEPLSVAEELKPPIRRLAKEISHVLQAYSKRRRTSGMKELETALRAVVETYEPMRQSGRNLGFSVEVMTHTLGIVANLHEMVRRLREINQNLQSMYDPSVSPTGAVNQVALAIDPGWLSTAIKAAAVVIVGIALGEVIGGPGVLGMALTPWLFVVLSRTFRSCTGDQGIFQNCATMTWLGIPVTVAAFLATPFLASFEAMTLFLFAGLFALGIWGAKLGGLTRPYFLSILAFSYMISWNAQKPVAFETAIHTYLGLVAALLFAGIFQRFFNPILPQTEIRKHLLKYCRACRTVASSLGASRADQAVLRQQIILSPSACRDWLDGLVEPGNKASLRQDIGNLLACLNRAGFQLLALDSAIGKRLETRCGSNAIEYVAAQGLELEKFFGDLEATIESGRRLVLDWDPSSARKKLSEQVALVRESRGLQHASVSDVVRFSGTMERARELLGRMPPLRDAVARVDFSLLRLDYAL